jgi:thiosulfate/3-mercaptopyruvate sulfurtransferase
LGHDNVAVLDGGIKYWQQSGYNITTALPRIKPASFRAYLNDNLWLSAAQVENQLARKAITLIDARTPERYRGEQEPIDPVAGHIPYALNRAFQLNLNAVGLFLAPDQLRAQFKQLIGDVKPEHVVHYCGSGVTACHNVLAMEHAGLYGSKLYAGSWSEWIRNKNRAVATCC